MAQLENKPAQADHEPDAVQANAITEGEKIADYGTKQTDINIFQHKTDYGKNKKPGGRKYRGQVWVYIGRRIKRSPVKSLFVAVLAALLLGAVGQFEIMRQSYTDLVINTKIEAKFPNGLPLKYVDQLMRKGYVTSPYYEADEYSADLNYSKADFVITNDIRRYVNEELEITYAEGYDQSHMKEFGKYCIVSDSLLKEKGLQLGDKVHVTLLGISEAIKFDYVVDYRFTNPLEKISDEEIIELYKDEITQEIERQGDYFTIIGSVSILSNTAGKYKETVFTPGILNGEQIFGEDIVFSFAEFTVADNFKLDEFREYVRKVLGSDPGTLVMDTGKVDNILKSLSLIEKAIPVFIAASLIILGLLCGLMILQSAKEAAILRVLGTTKKRVCMIFAVEQILICLAGLIVGILGLMLYNGSTAIMGISEKVFLAALLYFSGCLAGSLICSILITRRKVLGLLQTKE